MLAELQGAGHIPTSFLYILIFNAARKDGSEEAVDLALGLFLSLSESYKTKFVYTSIISALSAKGRGREAASLLEEAKLHGIVPDKVTKATRLSDAGETEGQAEKPLPVWARNVESSRRITGSLASKLQHKPQVKTEERIAGLENRKRSDGEGDGRITGKASRFSKLRGYGRVPLSQRERT